MYRYVGPRDQLKAVPYSETSSLAYCKIAGDPAGGIHVVGEPMSEIWTDSSEGRPKTHPSPFEGLSQAQRAALDEVKLQLIASIEAETPLAQGEKVLSDDLTYLVHPYDGHRSGAAVIRRETTRAELFFIIDEARFENGAIIRASGPSTDAAEPLTLTAVVSAFALSLVSGFASKVGAAIFDQIFGSNEPPAYFDTVYENLTQILRQEIERNNRETVADKMGGLTKWMDERYWPWKQNDKPPVEALYKTLEERLTPFYDGTLQILERGANRGPGALVYMAASSYYFAMLQEMALVNPKHQDNVHLAPENDGIRKASISHYTTLIDTWNLVLRERWSQFKVYKHDSGSVIKCWVALCTCKITAEDQLTKTANWKHYYCDTGCYGPAEQAVLDDMADWLRPVRRTQIQSLYAALGKPLEVAHQWAMLSFTPLPLPRVPKTPMFQYLYAMTEDEKLWVTPLQPTMQQSFSWRQIGTVPQARRISALVVHRERLYAQSDWGDLYEREPAIADLPWRQVARTASGPMISMNDGKDLWMSGNELGLFGPLPDLFVLGEPPRRNLSGPQHPRLRCMGCFHFGPESHRLVAVTRDGRVVYSDVNRETPNATFTELSKDAGKDVIDMTEWQLDSGQTHVFVAVNKTEIRSFGWETGAVGIKIGDGPGTSPIKAIAALTVPFPKEVS